MTQRIHLALLASALLAVAAPASAALETTFLYSLSSPTGVLPFSGVRVTYDDRNRELFVIGDGPIRVFNEAGMEIFTFSYDPEVGSIADLASLADGDLLALTYFEGGPALVRCNFRGEFVARIPLTGLPPAHAAFHPSRMRAAAGHIYFGDLSNMTVMVTGLDGKFERFFDVAEMLGAAATRRDLGMRGFNVDLEGNVLFTVQPLFQAFILSPTGELTPFGTRGSGPGKFNIVAGIARDERGNLYVSDILKSAVIVFDRNFRFIHEFGYRGGQPSNLVAPIDIAVGGGKVFVSQYANRGVSVFKAEDPADPAS